MDHHAGFIKSSLEVKPFSKSDFRLPGLICFDAPWKSRFNIHSNSSGIFITLGKRHCFQLSFMSLYAFIIQMGDYPRCRICPIPSAGSITAERIAVTTVEVYEVGRELVNGIDHTIGPLGSIPSCKVNVL